MKSLGVVAVVVIATWCASCANVNGQSAAAPAGESSASGQAGSAAGSSASSAASSSAGTESSTQSGTAADSAASDPISTPAANETTTSTPVSPVPVKPATSRDAVPKREPSEQAVVNQDSANNAHLSTPGGDPQALRYPAMREFLEDSQNAHDKMIVDRFLIGVAVLFAVIAAALLFSLPPKRREQKE